MKAQKIQLELNERVYKKLLSLVWTGLYGGNVEEAAERLICQRLEQKEIESKNEQRKTEAWE